MRGPGRKNVERELEMVRMYTAGQTLQEVGNHYGLTRERVRQLIALHGVTGVSGGSHKKAVDNRHRRLAAAKARRDARTILYYGCTYAKLIELNDGVKPKVALSNAGKFRQQKNNALARRVPWAITFPQWMQFWIDSGHWDDRARTRDGYVMARRGDTGAYALGNIYITTLAQNVADYQTTLKRRGVLCADGWNRLPERSSRVSSKTRTKVARLGKGRGWTRVGDRYQVMLRNKYLGTYATREEAASVYHMAVNEILSKSV